MRATGDQAPPRAVLDEAFRLAVWQRHGASSGEARELTAYAASSLHQQWPEPRAYPLPDAPCVTAWERYAREAEERGAWATLQRVLMQLRFPIARGMSQEPAYQAATRQGQLPDPMPSGPSPEQPDGMRIFLHPTPAGRVPVVLAAARADFELLVQAVTHRNEPVPVPAAVGAYMVAGYNNWDRIAEHRRAIEAVHADADADAAWAEAFRALLPQKERYQDRFMLLSSGPYSSTAAEAVGRSAADWRDASIRLRLEHECTHFFTRQAVGAMRVSLLDELVADYLGLVDALGEYRAAWFLRFLGIDAGRAAGDVGRLATYRGVPPLSDRAFAVLPSVVRRAAEHLEAVDPARAIGRHLRAVDKARIILALLYVGLEGLASDRASVLLAVALDEAAARVRDAPPTPASGERC